MSCPYYEIQKSEEYKNVAEIIEADKDVKHFVRCRRYTPFDLSNNSIKSAFDKDIRHSQSGYFKVLRLFSFVFPIMIAISLYVMIIASTENRFEEFIAIPLTTLGNLLEIVLKIF